MVTGVVTSALALMAAAKLIAHVDIATITVLFIVDFFLLLVSPAFLFRTTFIIKRSRRTQMLPGMERNTRGKKWWIWQVRQGTSLESNAPDQMLSPKTVHASYKAFCLVPQSERDTANEESTRLTFTRFSATRVNQKTLLQSRNLYCS
jgi:hypothetical protein